MFFFKKLNTVEVHSRIVSKPEMQQQRPPFQLTGDFSVPFSSMGLANTVDTQMSDGFQKLSLSIKTPSFEDKKQTPLEVASEMNRVIFSKHHDKSNVCGICHGDIKNKAIEVTPCGHYYHPSCLVKWRFNYMKETCPMCRTTISNNGRPTHGNLQLADPQRTISFARIIYNHEFPEITDEVRESIDDWDPDNAMSPIHLLPRTPNPLYVESMFFAMGTNLFNMVEGETAQDMADRWISLTATTIHLPATMRRWRFRWSDDPSRWFRFIYTDEHDWNDETPSLDIYNDNYPNIGWDQDLSDGQRAIYRERYCNVPELLVERSEDNRTLTVSQVWIPQLPGTLPSIEGGLTFDIDVVYTSETPLPSPRLHAYESIREEIVVEVEEQIVGTVFREITSSPVLNQMEMEN